MKTIIIFAKSNFVEGRKFFYFKNNFIWAKIILIFFINFLVWSKTLLLSHNYYSTAKIKNLYLKKYNLDSCSILLKRHPISTVLLIKIVKINFFFSCTYICIIIKSIVKTEYAYSFTKQMQIFSTHAALISDEAKNKIKIIL